MEKIQKYDLYKCHVVSARVRLIVHPFVVPAPAFKIASCLANCKPPPRVCQLYSPGSLPRVAPEHFE